MTRNDPVRRAAENMVITLRGEKEMERLRKKFGSVNTLTRTALEDRGVRGRWARIVLALDHGVFVRRA